MCVLPAQELWHATTGKSIVSCDYWTTLIVDVGRRVGAVGDVLYILQRLPYHEWMIMTGKNQNEEPSKNRL